MRRIILMLLVILTCSLNAQNKESEATWDETVDWLKSKLSKDASEKFLAVGKVKNDKINIKNAWVEFDDDNKHITYVIVTRTKHSRNESNTIYQDTETTVRHRFSLKDIKDCKDFSTSADDDSISLSLRKDAVSYNKTVRWDIGREYPEKKVVKKDNQVLLHLKNYDDFEPSNRRLKKAFDHLIKLAKEEREKNKPKEKF